MRGHDSGNSSDKHRLNNTNRGAGWREMLLPVFQVECTAQTHCGRGVAAQRDGGLQFVPESDFGYRACQAAAHLQLGLHTSYLAFGSDIS